MAVYVDNYMGVYGRMVMSHMMADTLPELHAFANKIGVNRRWFQDKDRSPHYDICESTKVVALANGAIRVDVREMAAYAWYRRQTGVCIHPKLALQRMRARRKATPAHLQDPPGYEHKGDFYDADLH